MSLVDPPANPIEQVYENAYKKELENFPKELKSSLDAKFQVNGIKPENLGDLNYVEAQKSNIHNVFADITNPANIAENPEVIKAKLKEIEEEVVKKYPSLKNYRKATISSKLKEKKKIQHGGIVPILIAAVPIVKEAAPALVVLISLFFAWRESVNCRQVASWKDRRSILRSLGVKDRRNIYNRVSLYVCIRSTEAIGEFSERGSITEYENGFSRMIENTPNELKEVIAYVSLLDKKIFNRAVLNMDITEMNITGMSDTDMGDTEAPNYIWSSQIKKRQAELEASGVYKNLGIKKVPTIFENLGKMVDNVVDNVVGKIGKRSGGKRKSRRNKKSKKSRKTRKSRKGKKSRRSKK